MRRADLCAVVVFALGCVAAVSAASANPFNPPVIRWSEMTRRGDPRAFATLAGFAACVLKRSPDASAKFLAMAFPSKQAEGEALKLASDNEACLTNTFVAMFTGEYLRGALIEAAYHEEEGTRPPYRLGSTGTGDMGLPLTVAQCVVESQPQFSAELLATRIAFIEQRRAFAKLEPTINRCAAEKGVRQVEPGLLRFHIAEVFYRRRAGAFAAGTGK